jgi:hypothetical protein
MAIFLVDMTFSQTEAAVSFPHEFLPLPKRGQVFPAVDGTGKVVCKATVYRVHCAPANDRTPIVTVLVPREEALKVRGLART